MGENLNIDAKQPADTSRKNMNSELNAATKRSKKATEDVIHCGSADELQRESLDVSEE